jgi:phosphohistidine swiveling domain-containing protein
VTSANKGARAGQPARWRFTCPLGVADEAQVGGKAQTLARLAAAGLPVPPGFVVTREALDAFLGEKGLGVRIDAVTAGIRVAEPDRLRAGAAEVRQLIRDTALPKTLREELRARRLSLLPGVPLAVRSSAIGEDSARASFAGQLDSILGVSTAEELEVALRSCWASYWSDRALGYRLAGRGRLEGMAVLVQALVPSCVSGVLFTEAPVGNLIAPDELLVEYGAGWGEAIVGGRVNPGRLAAARDGRSWRVLARPEECPSELEARFPTSESINTLAGVAGAVESTLSGPQDIEWTFDDRGQLAVLQARPITTALPEGGVRVVWSNANVNENFPEPVSPLLYSIAAFGYYHYFRNLGVAFGISRERLGRMEPSLRRVIGVHGARIYYNLSHIHTILRMAPFGDLLAEFFNRFVGADRMTPAALDSRWRERGRLHQAGELLVIAAKTTWQYVWLSRRVEAFERRVSAFAEQTRPEDLRNRSLHNLAENLNAFLDIRARWTDAALADAASMVCYGLLERMLRRAFPGEDQAALHNTLLKGLPDLVSSQPALRLFELARLVREDPELAALVARRDHAATLAAIEGESRFDGFRSALDAFLEQWGFRCSGELMLTTPSFQERPVTLLELLATYVAEVGEAPADVLRRQQRAREAETRRVLGILRHRRFHRWLPFLSKARLVGLVLSATQRAVAYRERARLKQALAYSRCRRIALALGDRMVTRGWLEARDDVFYLTWQELDALARGSAMFPYHVERLVALRKAEHAELRAMTPMDSFVLPEDGYLPTAAPILAPDSLAVPTPDELTGVAACGGRVTARATILADVSESGRLRAGDVLVTRQTDPGWGPIFPLVSGLVIERGGMLSHGAIIAREFGVPAVVGVPGATRRIPPGAMIEVDGDRGRVRVRG